MPNFNHVTLAGHLTRDPETKFFANEKQVTKFGLAVSRKLSETEEVLFIDVECWGKISEVAGKYLSKGAPALVSGRLKLDQWEDKQTGAKRSRIYVSADTLQLLGSKSDARPAQRSESAQSESVPAYDGDDEAPF